MTRSAPLDFRPGDTPSVSSLICDGRRGLADGGRIVFNAPGETPHFPGSSSRFTYE